MGYECKILLDSISETGKRLTTFQITFPRIVLAEFNTHRMFSRNSASSRAIPFKKQLERIVNDPFIPEQFPLNVKGMQPQEYVKNDSDYYEDLKISWLKAAKAAAQNASYLSGVLGVHKQIVNRLLEPFMWHTVICTATEFDNFFKLRCDENAQYEIRRIADLMYEAYHAFDNFDYEKDTLTQTISGIKNPMWLAARPQKLKINEWHCPLVFEEDEELLLEYYKTPNRKYSSQHSNVSRIILDWKKQISVARCARVSYLTHDGRRDIEKDLELFERLKTSGHWSPFEHVATPYYIDKTTATRTLEDIRLYEEIKGTEGYVQTEVNGESAIDLRSGNFIGWKAFRKYFSGENCTNFKKEDKN